MKVTQEKLPDSQLGLEIEIAPEASRSAYDKMVQNLARSSNIPGFRKGKVPRHILLQRIGVQKIKAAALEELIQKSLQDALKQESIDALGNYNLRSNFDELVEQYNPGDVLSFLVAVDIPPAPELGDYSNITVKAEEIVYDPKQVDDYLEQRRLQQADLIPVEERPAQMGDVAFVDFKGTLTAEGEEGKEIEGGSATNFQLELAEGKMIPGMVEGIVGMKPEETKEVSVTFPEDYPQEDLAGKPAIFSITLNELKTKELPELDDEFAEEASKGEFETLDALKESLTKQFTERAENQTKQNINNALVEVLLEQSTVELPDTLIQEEVTNVLTKTLMQMQQMGLDVRQLFTSDSVPRLRENARPEAIENLKQELILKAIATKEGLQPSDEAIAAKMAEITKELSGQDIDRDKLKTMVTQDLLAEKTFDWLREKAQIELVPEGSLSKSEADETEAEVDNLETESSFEAE
ncbi:MAG: trigger factor [Pleurocapsa sp.]